MNKGKVYYSCITSGVSRQLLNWVLVIESNRTGGSGCIKLAEVYYSIHDIVVLLIV